MGAGRVRETAAQHSPRARAPRATGPRVMEATDRGGEPDRAEAAREAGAGRADLRRDRISARLDRQGPPETIGVNGHQVGPEMTGIANGKAATIRVVPLAHRERERQG